MLRLRQDVPLFPGGLMRCATLSFDDGTVEDARICASLREHGLRATFNLNTGLFGDVDRVVSRGIDIEHRKLDASRIAEVYAGFELAVHGLTHARLDCIGLPSAAYEISQCKKELEDIVRAPVRAMAWPVCFHDPTGALRGIARSCGICCARTTRRTYSSLGLPDDFLAWDAACSFVQPELADVLEEFERPVDEAAYREPRLLHVWGHGYEAAGLHAWRALEGMLDRLAARTDTWFATNTEVCDYVGAVRSLVYSATGEYLFNPSRLDVWMLVDGEALCIPAGATVAVCGPA